MIGSKYLCHCQIWTRIHLFCGGRDPYNHWARGFQCRFPKSASIYLYMMYMLYVVCHLASLLDLEEGMDVIPVIPIISWIFIRGRMTRTYHNLNSLYRWPALPQRQFYRRRHIFLRYGCLAGTLQHAGNLAYARMHELRSTRPKFNIDRYPKVLYFKRITP